MPAWLVSLVATLWKFMEPYMAPMISAAVTAKIAKGQAAEDTLKGVEDAAKAGSDNQRRSFDERVQFLERRGRVRGLPE